MTDSYILSFPSVDGATRYIVLYETENNFSDPIILECNTSPATLTGLSNNTKYTYMVVAFDDLNNEVSNTGELSFTTGTPIPFTAPLNLQFEDSSANSNLIVSWTNGSGITQYNLAFSTDSANFTKPILFSNVTTPYSVTTLGNNTLYYCKLSWICTDSTNNNSFVAVPIKTGPSTSFTAPTITSTTYENNSNVRFIITNGAAISSYFLSYVYTDLNGDNQTVSLLNPISQTISFFPQTRVSYTFSYIGYNSKNTNSIGKQIITGPSYKFVSSAFVIKNSILNSDLQFNWVSGGKVATYDILCTNNADNTTISQLNVSSGVKISGFATRGTYNCVLTANYTDLTSSTLSETKTCGPPDGFSPPSEFSVNTANSVVIFSWTNGTGIDKYNLIYGINANLAKLTKLSDICSGTSVTLLPDTQYNCWLEWINNSHTDWNGQLDLFHFKTPSPVVNSPPKNFVENLIGTTLVLSWINGTNIKTYDIHVFIHIYVPSKPQIIKRGVSNPATINVSINTYYFIQLSWTYTNNETGISDIIQFSIGGEYFCTLS